MNRLSRILRPVETVALKTQNKLSSRSHVLFTDLGLIKPADSSGTFYLLPILQRSVDKCTKLIECYMNKLDAQKISIPNLTSTDLWMKSGRLQLYNSELFVTQDRQNKSLLLGPTYEEATTNLINLSGPISRHQLPLRLYQIGNKFRDEQMPRHGLLRSREFLMKDMYTFDADKVSAFNTYEEVNDIYKQLFKKLDVPFVKVEADATDMGGHISHEYHFLADIGDENLFSCTNCQYSYKSRDENIGKKHKNNECTKCNSKNLQHSHGIEIGHTFYLGDTYTKRQQGNYLQTSGKPAPLEMGCYGIGVTRLIAAAVESLSTDQEIRWPFAIAPFTVCIVPPKSGSKEEPIVQHFLNSIYKQLNSMNALENSIIVDDRPKLTIGKRLIDAKRFGFPLVVVIGSKAANQDNQLFELHFTGTNTSQDLQLTDLITKISNFIQNHTN